LLNNRKDHVCGIKPIFLYSTRYLFTSPEEKQNLTFQK
jgi:hypothetical protein